MLAMDNARAGCRRRDFDALLGLHTARSEEARSAVAEATYACSFANGQWNAEDWLPVRSPRWTFEGAWLQEADHIRNSVPLGASPAALQGERAGETYASMLHRHSVKSSLRVRAELSFDECMAPLITLAAEPAEENGSARVYASTSRSSFLIRGLTCGTTDGRLNAVPTGTARRGVVFLPQPVGVMCSS